MRTLFKKYKKYKLFMIGTSGILDEQELNRIILVNILCVVAASVIVEVGLVLCYFLDWKLYVVIPLAAEFIANASVLLLNHRQKFSAAAWMLYLIQCVMIAYMSIVLGRLLQLELVIILMIAIAFLIFRERKTRHRAVGAALVDLVILETVYYVTNSHSLLPVSYNAAFLIHALVLLAVIGIILLVSSPFVKSHDTYTELERANHFIKIFVAQVTHELRTPLDSIHHVTQLLKNEIKKDQYLKKIESLADIGYTVSSTARNIVNNVLTMAEIEAGKTTPVVNEAFKVRVFFEKVVEVHGIIAEREEMRLELSIEEQMPEVILGDPLTLNQIVTNLLANAFKYGAKKGVVRMEVTRQGVSWQLSVSNNGPGISPEKLRIVFDPFETGRTGQIQGSGLGLFIVKTKVAALSGTVQVESMPGVITKFKVVLPLREGRPKDLPDGSGVDTELADFDRTVVWVAEDDKLTAFLYSRFLKDMGCQATIVKNGKELLHVAHEKCPDRSPDIVILDCHMPVLNGEATIRELKRVPGLEHVPIIVTTGDIYSDNVYKMLAAGANTFLKKPIDHLALRKTMLLYVKKMPQN